MSVLALALLLGSGGEPSRTSPAREPGPRPAPTLPAVLGSGGPREIASLAEYEALVAEGDRARGTLLRTELYCAPLNSIGFRPDEDTPVALLALADEQGRIAGAECRWGREAQSPEFVLIVPPALSEPFAGSPRVEINFVQRRRVHARVEWLGRSEELALRYAGILHAIER